MTKIGVLALQGAFIEHISILKSMGIDAIPVRTSSELESVEGLIIPGGESTTMGIIAQKENFLEPLRHFVRTKPTWGTCAGMILLCDDVRNSKTKGQPILGGLHATVTRNYFGSQGASFETDLLAHESITHLEKEGPFRAIFIRAPVVTEVQKDVQVLATLPTKEIVAVKQNNILATSFHPELTNDKRWHKYFVEMVEQSRAVQ